MGTFIDNNDLAFSKQLKNFASKLVTYKTVLGITDAELVEAAADALFYDYVLQTDMEVETFAHNYKNYKNTARYGSKNTTTLGALPTLTAFVAPPTTVGGNIQSRFSQKAAKAKTSPNYTEAIGKDLDIEAAATTFNPTAGKPTFTLNLNANHPEIHFIKGKYNGVAIYKDAGDGYHFIDKAFYAVYIDKSALPAAGKSAIWKYKLIYLYHDAETGSMSDEASIAMVGG